MWWKCVRNPLYCSVLTLKTMLMWLGVRFSKELTWQSTEWVFSVICRKWCGSQFLYCKTGARGYCYTFAVVYGGVTHGGRLHPNHPVGPPKHRVSLSGFASWGRCVFSSEIWGDLHKNAWHEIVPKATTWIGVSQDIDGD